MSHDVLGEIVLLVAVSLLVVLVFQRLRVPAILGFIATGVLVGPGGLGLVRDVELVQTLAEFGVVLLLFMVGLEFSTSDLKRLGRQAVLAGAAQVALTVLVASALLLIWGLPAPRALFFGMLVSLSSTAVVFKLLGDRLELHAPHGRVVAGVLIFQDLIAIGFMLAIPALGRWLGNPAVPVRHAPHPVVVLVVVIVFLAVAWRVIPWILLRASRTGSREAFLFGIVLVALGAAWLASWAGASLALGAFVGGLLLAESELRSQIIADVLPFRDTLASVFFIAIGMSLDPRVLVEHPDIALASSVGLVALKLATGLAAFLLVRIPVRVAVAAALGLAQMGEFSFVLAGSGRQAGLLGPLGEQAFTAGAVFSLALTPLLVAQAPRIAIALNMKLMEWRAARAGLPFTAPPPDEEAPRSAILSDHVIIGGAGLNGQNVARVLRAVRLPHLVVDIRPDAVRSLVEAGTPVLLGDITQPLIQKHAGIGRARVLVLALSDPSATRHACRIARELSKDIYIVARTRYVSEIDELYQLGANQVIPEEFETSIEIFTSVLQQYHVPPNVIDAQILLLRRERYSLLRGRKLPGSVLEQLDMILTQGTTETMLLLQNSPAVGKTLQELGLTGQSPAVVAVVRRGKAVTSPPADFVLEIGDTLVITGTHADIDRVTHELG